MNSVSWFLYLTDLIGRVGGMAAAIVIIGCFVAVMGTIFAPLLSMLADEMDIDPARIWGLAKAAFVVWVCGGVIYIALPSKNTMYAIAASEVGEKVAATEAVQGIASDATKALQVWIRKQIGDVADSKSGGE